MSKTQIRKEIEAEVKSRKREDRRESNAFNRLYAGMLAGGLCFFAWHDILRYVNAAQPMNYALAGVAVFVPVVFIAVTLFRSK